VFLIAFLALVIVRACWLTLPASLSGRDFCGAPARARSMSPPCGLFVGSYWNVKRPTFERPSPC
jgi:hypothetical protein